MGTILIAWRGGPGGGIFDPRGVSASTLAALFRLLEIRKKGEKSAIEVNNAYLVGQTVELVQGYVHGDGLTRSGSSCVLV